MKRMRFVPWGLAALLALSGCGGGKAPAVESPSHSSGQVGATGPAAAMTRFAAARAADQATFGANAALVDLLGQQGMEAWIAAQFALPVTQMNPPNWVRVYSNQDQAAQNAAYNYVPSEFLRFTLVAPDQLRLRVSWALLQYIPINTKVNPYAETQYFNLLQRHATGNYGELIRDMVKSPAMGMFLDNHQNRPQSSECPSCAPNENFARELMQLFTLGVVQLNADGTIKRDSQGKPLETYSQDDVENLAAALTGWRFAPSNTPLPDSDWLNAGVPMVPETWAPLHDRTAKTVMGTVFPADRGAEQELETVVQMLMNHPNIGPFVSVRLIQHLVTSNPSPAYVGRVAAVFRNNGQGVAGDMKAVIRAVLMDSEARRGDVPGTDSTRFGKFREPMLWYTGLLRGMGCTQNLVSPDGPWVVGPGTQMPFNAPSVFSYYMPTDRAPGSNLLAPEQKIVNANELTSRLSYIGYLISRGSGEAAGCDAQTLGQAFSASPRALVDEISRRWFRGAMPPTLRTNLQALAVGQSLGSNATESAMVLTQYALGTPFYGVIK